MQGLFAASAPFGQGGIKNSGDGQREPESDSVQTRHGPKSYAFAMAGNPNDKLTPETCRRNARACREIAAGFTDREKQEALKDIARAWEQKANDMQMHDAD